MGLTSRNDIIEELVVFLRNNITDPKSRASSVTETFSGDDSETSFVLSYIPANIKTVTIGGVSKALFTDYIVDYASKTVTFLTAPVTGSDNISITYEYGSTWIYPSYPRLDVKSGEYPRIGVGMSTVTEDSAIGSIGSYVNTDLVIVNIAGRTVKEVRDLLDEVESDVLTNRTGFVKFPYITKVRESEILPVANRSDKVVSASLDFSTVFRYESL